MPLVIEKTIDLTQYGDNPNPKLVNQLSIVHETRNGELVQYYIDRNTDNEKDKNTFAVGIYDEGSSTYSYVDYDEISWNKPKTRICANRLEHISIKAFPNIGSIAVYKLKYRNISRILAPVNPPDKRKTEPSLTVSLNQSGDLEYIITPPEDVEYDCYRIVMASGDFSLDHITYDLTGTIEPPKVSSEYDIYCIAYKHEAQISSFDSNVTTLSIQGSQQTYEQPYYTKNQVSALIDRIAALEADMGETLNTLASVVEVNNGNS